MENVVRPFAATARIMAYCCGIVIAMLWGSQVANAQVFRNDDDGRRKAAIVTLHEDINIVSGATLKRRFAAAIDDGADVVILDIHSPGGMTLVTFELMDMVLEAKDVETVALIEKDAISGAALLSLACDKIVIRPDARIGDAGEIVMGADGAFRYTEAKSRSVLAQKVRDTAEATGRPLALAEKLVDKDLIVYQATKLSTGEKRFISSRDWESMQDQDEWELGVPIREAGEEMFFTVNGKRAVELGFADHTIESRDELPKLLNVEKKIRTYEKTGWDTLIWLLNTNFMAFLLILIGLSALMFELSAPGISIGGLVSVLCFALFFWSRFLGGTSGWFEVTLFVVGLVFVALEVFVIPGFGFAGISGIGLVIASLVMASRRGVIGESVDQWANIGWDLTAVLGAFAGFIILLIVAGQSMDRIPGLGRLTLRPPVAATVSVEGDASALLGWQMVQVGDLGISDSPLRPGGRARFGDHFVDVATEGDFVDAGATVTVVRKQGRQIFVRQQA